MPSMCTNNDQMNDSMCYSNSTLTHDVIITSLNKITRNNITMKLSLSLMHFRCSTTLGYGDEDSDSLQHLDDWTEKIMLPSFGRLEDESTNALK